MTTTLFKLDQNTMMESKEQAEESINGVDLFIESNEQPDVIAEKCLRHAGYKFKLVNISNRGTQVWPTGSVYTNLVNQYNVRFESVDDKALTQQDIFGLYISLTADFRVCSTELLLKWGNKKAYSLAQGQ